MYNFDMLKRGLLLLLFGASCAASFGQITNAGFELPAYSNGGFGAATGWTLNSSGGAWNIFPGYSFYNAEAPEGTQIGFCNGTAMAQQTGYLVKEGTNRVQVIACKRDTGFAASFNFQIWAGGTVSNGAISGGTLLATTSFNHLLVPQFAFTPLSLTYTASAGDPLIGQKITVRFEKTTGTQMNFDEVKIGFPAAPISPSGIETELGIPFGGDLPQVLASDDDYYYILNDENEPNGRVRMDVTGIAANPSYVTARLEASASRNDLSLFIQVRNTVTSSYQQYALGTSTLNDSTYTFKSASSVHEWVNQGASNWRILWIPNQDLEAADGWAEAIDKFDLEFYFH